MAQEPLALAPQRIVKLDEDCVNRIAAGEVLQRPHNAVKELLENALDAKATRIAVTCQEGGLKLLSIQDNGTGIRKEDLPLLCERWTTSKIAKFEDLQSLGTYGFRGEALASISYVAHLEIRTRTRDAQAGTYAEYANGKFKMDKATGEAMIPKPVACQHGTTLTIKDLFANTPSRRSAFRDGGSDEYVRILDVIRKYAIHNAGIAISLKKQAAKSTDLSTTANASALDNIAVIYNDANLRRELLPLDISHNEEWDFSARGHCSSPSYVSKKSKFLLFINNRLVDCRPLYQAIEAFYTTILAKGNHPFVYLSIRLNPKNIDVNVHPTKSEVFFLNQEEIVDCIINGLSETLTSQASSRRFSGAVSQQINPLAGSSTQKPRQADTNMQEREPDTSIDQDEEMAEPTAPPQRNLSSTTLPFATQTQIQIPKPFKVAPQKLVRTDAADRSLVSMFGYAASQKPVETPPPATAKESDPIDLTLSGDEDEVPVTKVQKSSQGPIKFSNCKLTSVLQLRAKVSVDQHQGLDQLFKNHVFVGLVGPDSPLALVQHEKKLYQINHCAVAEELFYQLGLRRFGKMDKLELDSPPALVKLVRLAVEDQDDGHRGGRSVDEIVQLVCKKLVTHREMLDEYFSLGVSERGRLTTLPELLPTFNPEVSRLPLFLLRIAVELDWTDEKVFFEGFLRELAYFYAPYQLSKTDKAGDNSTQMTWQIEHLLFPAFKKYLAAPALLLQKSRVVLLTTLPNLYKVFERC